MSSDTQPTTPQVPSRRPLTNRQKMAIWLIAVPLLVAGSFFSRQELAARAEARKPAQVEPPPVTVSTTRLSPETLKRAIRYSGTVKEWQRVDLSFRVGGTISEFNHVSRPGGGERDLHEGDRFTKGTVLARLDNADYQRDRAMSAEKLAQAESKLVSSRADADNARLDFARNRATFERGASARSDYDSAQAKERTTAASVVTATREVESAKVQLNQSDANLAYCVMTMPYDMGTIATRYVEVNERVSAGQKAFQVMDLSSVRIAFGVADSVVGRLEIGGIVTITSDALPDDRFQGVITKIAPSADSQTRTYLVEVRVAEPRGLRPGMVATATIGEDKTSTLLPLVAVTRETSGSGRLVVYKVVRDGERTIARACPVELEGVVDNRAAIKSATPGGVQPGDEVVVAGASRLFEGAVVKVNRSADARGSGESR